MNRYCVSRVTRLCLTTGTLSWALLTLSGCHSAFVEASILNRSGQKVRLVEVDYPSASFGTGELANGATFKYRFKVLGSGPATLLWTDLHEKEHTSPGPALEEGEEGLMTVSIGQGAATWEEKLHH